MSFDAAILFGVGEDLKIAKVSSASLREDEVLVRIVAAGVCHTDLIVQRGIFPSPVPLVLGHEGSGVVEQVGSAVLDLAPGDPVGLTFMSCGRCQACLEDRPTRCAQFGALNFSGVRADGTSALTSQGASVGGHFFGQSCFARYSVAHRRNVVKAPRDIPLELVGPFGCGIQTGAGAIFNTLRPAAGESCIVFGAGAVGLSAVMAATIIGCDPIVVVEPRASRRSLAVELGATLALDSAAEGLLDQLMAVTGGGRAVVDTTGMAGVVEMAIACLGHGGRLGLIGLHDAAARASFSIVELLSKVASIHAVLEGDGDPQSFIPYLLGLYREGRFPVDRLVRFYDFEDINQAIADQASGEAIKPVLLLEPRQTVAGPQAEDGRTVIQGPMAGHPG